MTRKLRIDQQHAGLVGGADAHALDDGAGLRFPVEMDRQNAGRGGVRLAAGADAGAIGGDLGIAEQRLAFDVARDIVVARAQSPRIAKPFGRRDVLADDAIAIGAAVGQHVAVEIAEPQIEIDGVGAEDHGQPLRHMGDGRRIRGGRAIDDGGIGGPPAHVAGALIEVAVDQLDGVERQIHHALAARAVAHPRDRVHQIAGAVGELAFELPRDGLDLLADIADFLRDHGKAGALRAGARAFDQRVQRQHLHLVGDLLDRFGLVAGDLVDLGGEPRDQRGDVGFILVVCRIGRCFGGRSCKRDGHLELPLPSPPRSISCRANRDLGGRTFPPLSRILPNSGFNFPGRLA